jgi:hypothetical protein
VHRNTRSLEVFCLLSEPLAQLLSNLVGISETFATKVVFSVLNKSKAIGAPSPGYKANVQEVPTVVLEFSPVLLELYGI